MFDFSRYLAHAVPHMPITFAVQLLSQIVIFHTAAHLEQFFPPHSSFASPHCSIVFFFFNLDGSYGARSVRESVCYGLTFICRMCVSEFIVFHVFNRVVLAQLENMLLALRERERERAWLQQWDCLFKAQVLHR